MRNKITAFVPIKLNSSRLPSKNILNLGGKPMCQYIFEALLQLNDIDEIYVYCSDEAIKKYLPKNIKFLKRDKSLDGYLVKGKDIYAEFIKTVDSEYYLLCHTTSPFLTSESIQEGINAVLSNNFDSSFAAEKVSTFTWYENKPLNYLLDNIPRTQDIKPVMLETSGFYLFKKEIFTEKGRRIGDHPHIVELNNIEAIDIDTQEDFNLAKKIIK
jgi:CMP-N-acetylneuraminic acid synthetase